MMARPWWTSSTGVLHGGTTCRRLKCVNGHRPFALHAAARSSIGLASAPAALNGTSGSRVSRLRTSSIAQNAPRPRTSPTLGVLGLDLVELGPDDVGAEHAGVLDDALLRKMLMLATAEAQASGWPRVGQPTGVGAVRNVSATCRPMTTPPSGR